jgi:hypothetical protein
VGARLQVLGPGRRGAAREVPSEEGVDQDRALARVVVAERGRGAVPPLVRYDSSSTASRPPSGTSATTGAGGAMSRPLPGHQVQLDMKFIEPLPGSRRKHYQFTAIDDCTRLRVLRRYPQLNQKTAIQFLDNVLERLPFRVEVIQTLIHLLGMRTPGDRGRRVRVPRIVV